MGNTVTQGIYAIEETIAIAQNTFRLRLLGDSAALTKPGQFVNIALPGSFLRRPISVSQWDPAGLTLIFKAVGQGTALLRDLPAGTKLDLLCGLGNGFDPETAGDAPLLAGGGVGTAPLLGLAQALVRSGKPVRVVLGFNTKAEVFGVSELEALGASVIVTTLDGSMGCQGFPTAVLPDLDFDSVFACGPEPLLKALYRAAPVPGQYSLEARMGCGWGACMGCTLQTATGPKRVCKDGPVFDREVLEWN